MAVYEIEGIKPDMHETAYVADSAQVMGNVTLAAHSSIWFGVIVRGDNDNIHVGEGSNIQDGSVLHSDVGKPLYIGKHVTVGHMVMLHGCSVDDGCLIGIGTVILNEAKIGKNCIVGARSLVTEGKEFPDGSMIMGTPAKVVRQLTTEEINYIRFITDGYVKNAQSFKNSFKKIS
ncbi:MAG: gamma carbonic anhydrase family protein [Limnohabitans sp.]|nr:gamma carbonic anhydrase family protein [Limnohabitans sp.]